MVYLRADDTQDRIDLVVVDFATRETLSTATIDGPDGNRHRGGHLAGEQVVIAFNRSVELYTLDGEHIRTLFDLAGTEPGRAVTSHLVSPNGRTVVVTDSTGGESETGRLHIIDIANGRIRRTVSGDDLPGASPVVIRWSADGQVLYLRQGTNQGVSGGDWLFPISPADETTELTGDISGGLTWRVDTEASATCLRRDGSTIRLSRRGGSAVAHTIELRAAEVTQTMWSADDRFVFIRTSTWSEPQPQDCSNLDGPPTVRAIYVYSLQERRLTPIGDSESLLSFRSSYPTAALDSLGTATDVVVAGVTNSAVGLLYPD